VRSRAPNCRTDPWTLKPRQTGAVGIEVHGGYSPAILFDAHHVVIGCLPFRLNSRATIKVDATAAVPCGAYGGVDAARNQDWPDPNK
jgi:hypothetical protein